jgi:two-component system cell cycle sensor histidine kinase/response regulator CckA
MQKTILVVDADLSVLSVIKCMLESGDYNVLIAHSAESALRMAERDDLRIDLMLVEVLMPDVTGPDLAERIRAIRPHQKALFMSGCAASQTVRVKVLDHALGFLPKPFTADSLLQRVNSVLNPPAWLGSYDPDEGGGTPGEGCAGVVSPLLPRRPRRPPMAGKMPLPE